MADGLIRTATKQVYLTPDNREFGTQKEAERHLAGEALRRLMDRHGLLLGEQDATLGFLVKNASAVAILLKDLGH